MSYPCTGCGVCCKRAGVVVTAVRKLRDEGVINDNPHFLEMADFPYGFDETGKCEMLADDNTCKVYDHRPDICNVEMTWAKHHQDLTKEEYFNKSIDACNDMMIADGTNPKYHIVK